MYVAGAYSSPAVCHGSGRGGGQRSRTAL